jgi:alpha-D-ribose 1-methylphosphonate 5-phosphate C-P lyase
MPEFIKITEKEILDTPNYFKLGELVSKKYWKEVDAYDTCVLCGATTPYLRSTHIDHRIGYVEGAGQTCPDGCKKS